MRAPGFIVACAVALGASACAGDPAQCELGTTSQAVQSQDRKILGAGSRYVPDGSLRARQAELHASQDLRRAAAWRTVAKILAPAAIADVLPNMPGASLPRWQTWYGKDDVVRLFNKLYQELGNDDRAARARFSQAAIDAAFGWNVDSVDELDNWPAERWQAYADAIDTADELAGVGGVGRVGYSPGAVRHLLRSYPEVLDCRADGVPDAFADTPGDAVAQLVRTPVRLDGCASRTLGPFFVSAGEQLIATLEGGGRGSRLSLHRSALPADDDCVAGPDKPCTASGAGSFYVTVSAGTRELDAVVQVDYAAPNAAWAGCLESGFPGDAVVVKTAWHRAQFERQLPVFDTSAAGLSAAVASNDSAGWGEPTAYADPGPEDIYTMQLPNGNRYRLAGLHIMTKELDHWWWISLWWSDTPDSDFGADRPDDIAALPGPWRNYKMCAVSMFDERDPDPTGGFATSAPSLGAALATMHGGVGAPSWCSNPYLEEGPGNMTTNCIGCHQHGGTALTSELIVNSPDEFPAHGRTLLRNNFPHDYSWALTAGDRIGLELQRIVNYFSP